jgi:hypothetical protein
VVSGNACLWYAKCSSLACNGFAGWITAPTSDAGAKEEADKLAAEVAGGGRPDTSPFKYQRVQPAVAAPVTVVDEGRAYRIIVPPRAPADSLQLKPQIGDWLQ